jgi:hypothetical protein
VDVQSVSLETGSDSLPYPACVALTKDQVARNRCFAVDATALAAERELGEERACAYAVGGQYDQAGREHRDGVSLYAFEDGDANVPWRFQRRVSLLTGLQP